MKTRYILPLALGSAAIVACGTDSSNPSEPESDSGAAVDANGGGDDDGGRATLGPATYHGSVRALVEENCANCHYEGGIGPFALDTEEAVIANQALIVDSVESGRMPPWNPEPNCREIMDSRALEAEEVARFVEWRDAGYPLGDEADYAAPVIEAIELGEPDIILSTTPYAPKISNPDDYHCLVAEQTFDVDTYMTGYDVYPDRDEIVHHVLLYLIPPESVDELMAREAREEGPGFTCYGATGVSGESVIAAWAPGGQPVVLPEDSAFVIPAGSRIVVQTHYNVLGAEDPQNPPEDATQSALWTLPPGEVPLDEIHYVEFANFNFNIPAGDPSYTESVLHGIPLNGDIVATLPHMHQLGRAIEMRFESMDGSRQECLTNIQDWDFNWQQAYFFPEGQTVPVVPGDRLMLSCTWDNSPENQPIVNGERLDPRDVDWGDGTYDEMCYAPMFIRTPYYAGEGVCGGFDACYDDCGRGDGNCFIGCAFNGGEGCVGCLFDNVEDCFALCPGQVAALGACLDSCNGLYDCLTNDCSDQLQGFVDCAEPLIRAGECGAGFNDECGAGLTD